MKLLIVFLGIIFSYYSFFGQCNNVPIDLNTWTAQGGTWNVSGSGTSVNQTLNGGNVYFLSPQPFINVIISGTLRTEDADDDQMGFVFGVEGTIGTSPFHYYVLQWDQGGDGNGMYVKEYDQTGLISTPLALVGNHWTRSFNHNFTLTYQSSKVIITMDGTTVLDLDGCFNPGNFGFYNSSQAFVTYSNFIYLPTPDFQFTSNDSICIYEPALTDIFCLSTSINPYSEIRWDYGDGTIVSNVTNSSHNYTSPGTYNLELYVKDFLGCEDSITKQITVFDPSFTLGVDQSLCPGAFSATFASSNTNAGNSYSWSSGETTPSITKNSTNQYRLTLTDANGCIAKDTVNLVVGVLPPVSFNATSECLYDTVNFVNNTNSAQSVLWYFGDGNTSTLNSPNYKYTTPGTYTPKLIATFGQGCKDSTEVTITIYDAPIADFSGVSDCYNKNALFSNNSTIGIGLIVNNIWDFGDFTNGNQINESHLYTSEGNYNVTLITISNNLCYDTIAKTFDRYASPFIAYSLTDKCIYDSVQFTNNSTVNTPSVFQTYNWSFGDGITSNNINPYHNYSTFGNFTTKLIGTTQFGCKDSLEQQVTIFDVPNAQFSFINDCYNALATFTDQSTMTNGTITDWLWNFGDGLTGFLDDESHLFNSDGNFETELIVTSDNNCTDTITHTITRYPLPVPAYIASSICVYDEVQFNDASTINAPETILGWEWSFGPGLNSTTQSPNIIFPTGGSNPVKLVAISNHGCKDSISQLIDIYYEPIASFISTDDCNNIPATFINNSTVPQGNITNWEWDLGDGNTSTTQNLTHNYSIPNTYIIELIVTTNNNCKDTINQTIIRYPIPNASYNYTNKCTYDMLPFNNESTIGNGNSIIDYSWNFGDGSNLDQNENTAHQFNNSGLYEVKLSITSDNNCIDDTTIYVEAFAVPQVNFIKNDKCINEGASLFNNGSSIISGNVSNWNWNFGDGLTSTSLNPLHQYSNSGNYNVTLIGTSDNGCTDTIIKSLSIFNKPTSNFFIDKTEGCIPLCAYFADLSTDDNTINFWQWTFEEHESSLQQFPNLCFEEAGEFDVSLIVTNMFNCKDTMLQANIIVAKPNPIADFQLSPEKTDILHPIVSITNNSFDVATWNWNLGNNDVDSVNYNITNNYEQAGTYPITLIIENQYGCTDSISKDLTVLSKALYYIPNSFTPNSDGINDVFKIEAEDLNFLSLTIFDRWGKSVYFSEDINQFWDGSTNGLMYKDGTYVWVLRYIDKNDNKHADKGSVTLIR